MKISVSKKLVLKFVVTIWNHSFRFTSLQNLFVDHQQLVGISPVINNINFMCIIRTSHLLRQSIFRL